MSIQQTNQANRIVVKVGSSTLTYGTGLIHLRRFERLSKSYPTFATQEKKSYSFPPVQSLPEPLFWVLVIIQAQRKKSRQQLLSVSPS